MKTEHLNNLINLVAMTVDELHRVDYPNPIGAMEKHLNNTEWYGNLPKEVKDHIVHVAISISNHINNEYEY